MSVFIKRLFYSTLLIVILGIFPFLSLENNFLIEIAYSFLISLINAIVGYYLVLMSIDKPDGEFYTYVYGGMLARMFVVFAFSIYIIKNGFVSMTPYMLFLILFYTIHQWVEISSWLKEIPAKKIQLNS